ncbi:MAG: gliding motility-associated C-terminal domain-containing protein [Ferruginibacter sp.]
MKKYLLIAFLFSIVTNQFVTAQTCTNLGQNPETAFPVCGTTVFNQGSVAICGGAQVPSACQDIIYADKNPYWYKFTCFGGGSLAFVITPIDLGDDYDWQLFDVTGRNPSAIYSDPNLFVACNWSAEPGLTGADASGTSLVRCQGPGVPQFSQMPTLMTGHNYVLLVSHFTDSQVGYSLSFGGGTANITDPVPPHTVKADAGCDGTTITVKLNKKMKCNSLAADGSDFSINSAATSIIAASGVGCTSGFDMDSVVLTLNNPIAPGTYIVTIKDGTDGNTLKDNCDRTIPPNETLPITIFPLVPTPMDSLTKPGCSPQTLELVFRKPIRCSSIAADGSDFSVIGPYPVTVTGATGNCETGLTSKIFVQLSVPMQVAGNFIIRLNNGSDGNSLLDNCAQQTAVGSFLPFAIKDTVNADFTYSIVFGCLQNVVSYSHNGNNGVNSWNWNFDNIQNSSLQNPVITYTSFDQKKTSLIVSNGVCSDTSSTTLFFDNLLHAKFEITSLVCPGDKAVIKNTTVGNVISNWSWDLGNGNTSNVKDPPPQTYNVQNASYGVLVKLIVTNNYGCQDSAFQKISIINNCYIAVPSAFTPNGDGLNDYLYPLNAYKAFNLDFTVYNRFGQRLFHTKDWTNKWDGTFKGQGADPGTYVWILTYINTDTGKRVEQKGTTVLIR